MKLPTPATPSAQPFRPLRPTLAMLLGFCALASGLHAQTWTWNGSTSSDWDTDANWSTGSVPGGATGNVVINTDTPNAPVVDTIITNTAGNIRVAQSGIAQLTINPGGLLIARSVAIGQGAGSQGHLIVAGGTISTTAQIRIGDNGSGTLTMSAGRLSAATNSSIAQGTDSNGYVALSGGTMSFNGSLILANGVNSTGFLDITGGLMEVGNVFGIGNGDNSTGTLSINGGEINVSAAITIGNKGNAHVTIANGILSGHANSSIGNGANGTGHAEVRSGGTLGIGNNILTVGNHGSGTLTLSDDAKVIASEIRLGNQAAASGHLEITGDAISITNDSGAAINIAARSGTSTLAFNHSGTLTLANAVTGAFQDIEHKNTGLTILTGNNTATGTFTLTSGAVQINAAANLFNAALKGQGTLILDNTGAVSSNFFNTAQAVAETDFTGLVRLQNNSNLILDTPTLGATTKTILSGATLQLGSDGTASFSTSAGTQSLADTTLDFDGGILKLATTPEGKPAYDTLEFQGITVTSTGFVQLSDYAAGGATASTPGVNFIDQSNITSADATLLVKTTDPVTQIAQIKLLNAAGAEVAPDTSITYSAQNVTAHYGSTALVASGSAGNGLYLSYNLTGLEIHTGRTFTLNTTTATLATLAATIYGDGSLLVSGKKNITITAPTAHTGSTTLATSVTAGAADIFAANSNLTINARITFDTSAYNQSIQSLSGAGTVVVGSTLTITGNSDATFSGAINGAGDLVKTGDSTQTMRDIKITGLTHVREGTLVANMILSDLANNGTVITTGNISGTVRSNTGYIDIGASVGGIASNSGTIIVAKNVTNSIDGNTGVVTVGGNAGDIISNDGDITITTNLNRSVYANTGTITVLRAISGTIMGNDGFIITTAHVNAISANSGTIAVGTDVTGDITGNNGLITITRRLGGSVASNHGHISVTGNINGDIISNDGDITTTASLRRSVYANSGAITVGMDITGSIASNSGTITVGRDITGSITANSGTITVTRHIVGSVASNHGHINVTGNINGAEITNAGILIITGNITGSTAIVTNSGFLSIAGKSGRYNSPIPVHNTGVLHNGNMFEPLALPGLTGSGTMLIDVDLAAAASSAIRIAGAATGAHTIVLNDLGTAPRWGTLCIDLVKFETGDATITAANAIDRGMDKYEVVRGSADNPRMPGSNAWYLTGTRLSNAGDAVIATAGAVGMDWHYSLDTLRLRLGELRSATLVDAPSDGAWVRANAYYLTGGGEISSPFSQHTYGINAGRDFIRKRATGALILGGFLGAIRTERDYDGNGDGTTTVLAAGLYATWLHRDGWYADLVLRADWYKNQFDVRAPAGDNTHGNYDSMLYGGSVEFGRRLQKKHLWLEPSLQVAAASIEGADYTAKNPLYNFAVSVRHSTAFQYRAQVRSGIDLGPRWQPYVRFGAVCSYTKGGRINAEGRTFTPDFDGFRVEAGLGAAYAISKQNQIYLDYEYAKAKSYERPWALNLGYRYLW